ncbi:MAG: hypothetical protein ACRDRJ_53225, partial [Streptosporangiaceae bacterium]
LLADRFPSPVVELNRAVAVAMLHGPAAGLELVDAVAATGALDDYHLLHAVRGDLLTRLGRELEGGVRAGGGGADGRHRAGRVIEVPGLAALNKGRFAGVQSVSCGSAGNCTAGGYYADADLQDSYGFVVSEKHGVWGKASPMPGLAATALNKGGSAEVGALSCRPPGSCAASGAYTDHSGHPQGLVTQGR